MTCSRYGFKTPARPAHVPHLIALCGFPKSGKSEVQRILSERFGVHPVDDGYCLRQFAQQHLGLSHDDVYTQEGKARRTEVLGHKWQNRDILGTLGAQLEAMFGEHIMPWIACRGLDRSQSYSFGSVRKTQGGFFKQKGGVVIAVRRPGVAASPFAFDAFDESLVDIWIDNDGDLAALEDKVVTAIDSLALFREAAE
jgi:hypothetical protein